MKRIFNAYYKPWLIGALIIMAIKVSGTVLGAETPQYDVILPAFIIGVILLTLLCGGVYHFFYEYIRPKRIKKLIKRPRLEYLRALGFEFDQENHLYNGFYRSFYLTIEADTGAPSGNSIIINAFIIPDQSQQHLITELLKKYEFNFDNELCWLTRRIPFIFNTPKQPKFEKALTEFIEGVRSKGIKPMIFE